jgi:hypothetical protein
MPRGQDDGVEAREEDVARLRDERLGAAMGHGAVPYIVRRSICDGS